MAKDLQAEVDRLRAENERLKAKLAKRTDGLPKGVSIDHAGRYRVRVKVGDTKLQRRFRDRETAIEYQRRAKLKDTLLRDGLGRPRKRIPTVLELIDEYLRDCEKRVMQGTLADSTYTYYHERAAGWHAWILKGLKQPTLRPDELDPSKISAYVGWRTSHKLGKGRRTAGPVIARKDLAFLRRLYAWKALHPEWRIPAHLPTRGKPKRPGLEPEQMLAMLEQMPEGTLERTVAEVQITTGLRPGDVFALREQDIDFDAGLIRLQMLKTDRPHAVGIGQRLEHHLRAWLCSPGRMRHVKGLVFHLSGRPCTQQTLRRRFYKASQAVGIEPPIEYMGVARNLVARWLRNAGVTADDIAMQLGHASTDLVPTYTRGHLPIDRLREVAEKVDRILGGGE